MNSISESRFVRPFQISSSQARCIRAVLLEALTDGVFVDDAAAARAVREVLAQLVGGLVGVSVPLLDLDLVVGPGDVANMSLELPESRGASVLRIAVRHVQRAIPEWDREVRLGVPADVFSWWVTACGRLD